MADTEAVAGMSQSDTAGSKPKAYPPVKRLTLAQGRERVQTSKAVAAAKAGETSAKKRTAPNSSPGGSSSKLFSDSESENEVGAIREHREVSSDLDEQQQYYAAAAGLHARQSAAVTAVGSSSGGGASYSQGYFPPEPGTGAPALLEKLTAPRGLIGGTTQVTLKEFATLRKKPEDKGGLHPVWGFHWVKPNENMTWGEVEDLFWRCVQRKGYSDQAYKELREDRTLSAILDMRELRIEFVQLVSKRKLRPKMDELNQEARAKAREERERVCLELLNGLPRAIQHRVTPPLHEQLAPTMEPPLPDDSFHVVVDLPITIKEGWRWPRTTMATSQRQRSRMLGPRARWWLCSKRRFVFSGTACTSSRSHLALALAARLPLVAGQPGAVERLRVDVASLFRETRDLHGRVDRRADLSSYDSLRGHAPHPEQQPHSYQIQFDQGPYGAPAYATPMYAVPSYDQRAYQVPYCDPTPRFEELRSSPLDHPPIPAVQPEPESHCTS
ncbi:hypothetical protein PR002_g25213 [Phytophthora rubi]|uniref:Uncharacterized protein n=1 Tax=Phytophthora rubi TaxID=129364 RepID=A0A6A3I9J7_9STRA|nr:hypothetical protein PR002_g25213 [Phytophthora rubi]